MGKHTEQNTEREGLFPKQRVLLEVWNPVFFQGMGFYAPSKMCTNIYLPQTGNWWQKYDCHQNSTWWTLIRLRFFTRILERGYLQKENWLKDTCITQPWMPTHNSWKFGSTTQTAGSSTDWRVKFPYYVDPSVFQATLIIALYSWERKT